MSTEPVTTHSNSIDVAIGADEDAATILESLKDAAGICRWCFARRCRYYESHERADLPERDVDPSAYHETVPDRTDERGDVVDPARRRVVCGECGVIDPDPTDDRTVDELLAAVDNIGDRLAEQGLAFSPRAGRHLVETLRERGRLGGNDTAVLERAIVVGRRWGEQSEPNPDYEPE